MATVTLGSSCLVMALCFLLLTAPAAASGDIAVTPSSPHEGAGSPMAAGPGPGPAPGPASSASSCHDRCTGWSSYFCNVKCYFVGAPASAPSASPAPAPARAPSTA